MDWPSAMVLITLMVCATIVGCMYLDIQYKKDPRGGDNGN